MKCVGILFFVMLWARPALAHGFGVTGMLHPLTGPDHMLAMIAVGAWSGQLDGRAIWAVPAAFLMAMTFGGILGMSGNVLPWTEGVIALSVILLGGAVLVGRHFTWPFAICGVIIFGVAHGLAHGSEFPQLGSYGAYAVGFLVTTAGLHIVGLVGALLILDSDRGGCRLRFLGGIVAVMGFSMFAL